MIHLLSIWQNTFYQTIIMSNFEWKIKKTASQSRARTGIITTPHGKINTPAFIFCGTKAALKSISVEEARKCGTQIVLSNTYH